MWCEMAKGPVGGQKMRGKLQQTGKSEKLDAPQKFFATTSRTNNLPLERESFMKDGPGGCVEPSSRFYRIAWDCVEESK